MSHRALSQVQMPQFDNLSIRTWQLDQVIAGISFVKEAGSLYFISLENHLVHSTDIQDMDISYKKTCMAFGIVAVLFVVVLCSRNHLFQEQYLSSSEHAFSKDRFKTTTVRRLLASPADYDVGVGNGGGEDGDGDDDGNGDGYGDGGGDADDDRIRPQCSADNIYISQGQTPPLTSGIPTYTVIIQNICMSGSCSISDIHLSCGWFSSARLINPNLFKRISYDDCLVNNGNPISPGQTISFQYANTYPYPMSVSSLSCH